MSQSKQHLQLHREALQRKTQQDWANREYVELMASSIARIADFLNAFSRSCTGRLAHLDAKLTSLERKVSFLEAKIGLEAGADLPGVGKIISNDGNSEEEEEEDESYLESFSQSVQPNK